MSPGWNHSGNAIAMTECDADFSKPESSVDDENDLKVEINTFVWGHAPDAMPLGKADELACKIFELFIAARAEHAS